MKHIGILHIPRPPAEGRVGEGTMNLNSIAGRMPLDRIQIL